VFPGIGFDYLTPVCVTSYGLDDPAFFMANMGSGVSRHFTTGVLIYPAFHIT
jgi:hypothetical protein